MLRQTKGHLTRNAPFTQFQNIILTSSMNRSTTQKINLHSTCSRFTVLATETLEVLGFILQSVDEIVKVSVMSTLLSWRSVPHLFFAVNLLSVVQVLHERVTSISP